MVRPAKRRSGRLSTDLIINKKNLFTQTFRGEKRNREAITALCRDGWWPEQGQPCQMQLALSMSLADSYEWLSNGQLLIAASGQSALAKQTGLQISDSHPHRGP